MKRASIGLVLLLSACGQSAIPPRDFPDREAPVTRHTTGESGDDKDPDLSRDGKLLFFASTAWSDHYDIYAKSIGGNVLTRITSEESDERFPKVNPRQPRMLAFCSNLNGEWDIFVVEDYVREPAKWVRVSETGSDDIHPSWSPDGTKVVYCSTSGDGMWVLKVRDLLLGRTQVLEGVDGLLPEWHPVEDRIVFQRMRHRDRWFGSVWTLELDRDMVRNVMAVYSGDAWAAINPSWSPDGSKIVFATVARSRARAGVFEEADDLWAVDADGSHPVRLTTDAAADWMPAWSATGEVFFVSRRSGRNRVWSMKPALP
ncbi:MAG: PD40 domain-containing protein [Planctomycetes bacterium]|nr:PD40 domain-containing protein [Planctomycetota bacterium]